MSWPQPLVGVPGKPEHSIIPICWGHFPHAEDLPPYEPWDYKERPVLILALAEDADIGGSFVAVGAMGTSKFMKNDEGWLLIGPSPANPGAFKMTGLETVTAFNLNRLLALPYTPRWFTPPPSPPFPKRNNPQLGGLPDFYMEAYRQSKLEAGVDGQLKVLGF